MFVISVFHRFFYIIKLYQKEKSILSLYTYTICFEDAFIIESARLNYSLLNLIYIH